MLAKTRRETQKKVQMPEKQVKIIRPPFLSKFVIKIGFCNFSLNSFQFFDSQKFIVQNPKNIVMNTFVFVPTNDRVPGLDVSGDIIGDITLGFEHESPTS